MPPHSTGDSQYRWARFTDDIGRAINTTESYRKLQKGSDLTFFELFMVLLREGHVDQRDTQKKVLE